jgi:hypothetical protein
MFRIRHIALPWQAVVAMAVATTAGQTYNARVIREDLQDAENRISPTETPFISMIATDGGKATNTYHEWPLLALSAVNSSNRVAEGEDAPVANAPNYASRRGNYTQISTKTLKLSDTSQAVNDAAQIITKSKQITYKLLELKRDKETMLLDNVAAAPGAVNGGSVRVAAGMAAFYLTNTQRGATGTASTLSGGTNGYPNAAGAVGTARALTEDMLNTGIQAAWNSGGRPKYVLVSPTNKRVISKTFNAYGTRYNSTDSKKLISAVDVYQSDFGEVQIVPDRFVRGIDVHILDPEYVAVCNMWNTRQQPLARTGLTDNTLISAQYTLWVGNEAAHSLITDTQG